MSRDPEVPSRPKGSTTSDPETAQPPDAAEARDRQFVTALARGLEVLRALTPRHPLLGNQELAARTGLPKPTISRLTHTLTRLGSLSPPDGGTILAFNCGGPSFLLSRERLVSDIGPRLVDLARNAEAGLMHR